jgi:hypothetical protein
MATIRAKTYEGTPPDLVVQHVFYGETLQEAQAVLDSHLETDTFLDASMSTQTGDMTYRGTFEGITLKTVLDEKP